MLNDPLSHGLWELTAPPAPSTAPLLGETTADVAIIGGGYAGLSAALRLAEAGASVALLEAVEIGFGAAGRNCGLVNAGMWVMPDSLPQALGATYGERLINLLGEAPREVFKLVDQHGIACEDVRVGTLHCAADAKGLAELKQREAQWLARGADVQLLGAAETAAKTGSKRFPGALLDRRAGTIQPLAYARGLATAAKRAGARLFTSSPVNAVARDGAAWALTTPKGRVVAKQVIVATDAYAAGPWGELSRAQTHLPYFNMATAPLSLNLLASILPEKHGAWDTRIVLSSFRLDQAGRLIYGSCGALRFGGLALHRAWAIRAARRVFPQLGEVAFETAWWGRIGMTADHLPRFHRLADGVVAISGYNGRGIAPGTVFGRVLADHVLGRIAEADLPLPTAPVAAPLCARPMGVAYEAGAQLVHLIDDRV
jgi:glycine/D-amino acid oxidase-like deaminating enzyme